MALPPHPSTVATDYANAIQSRVISLPNTSDLHFNQTISCLKICSMCFVGLLFACEGRVDMKAADLSRFENRTEFSGRKDSAR